MASRKEKLHKVVNEKDKKTYEEFNVLCSELNLDTSTSNTAWESYMAIKENYTLEGNQLHWLACALFVACHNSHVPTVNHESTVEGNGVSLTKLLRCCKLALIQFFNKAKKWADMSNLKNQFREKIDSLERNFAVSNVIFKKYQPIFVYLFKDPAQDPPKTVRSRKQKKPPCTPGEIFDFCWLLFIRVKQDFAAISDDLVNSYHLLLSCVDYIYGNAVMAQRSDLLNERFESLCEGEPPSELPCIVDTLCSQHDGLNAEVKAIRAHWWRPHIKKLFQNKTLKGDPEMLSGILDVANFETNVKNIRKDYEMYVLSIGEYDERVFLGEDANEEIGTPSKLNGPECGDLREKIAARRNLATQFDGSGLTPNTPLSGKHYLQAKEQLKVTPVSTATYLVSRLNALLGKREPEPGPRLQELFKTCSSNPEESIVNRVKQLGETFCSKYTAPSQMHPGSQDYFARMRLKMGVIMYYKLLEAILLKEKAQNKPLGNLLEQDIFHNALFACCMEIVIFSYNSQRTFPWILDTFSLEPFHFYKVIEVIIRTEDSLPRDVVKHLQRIEEQTLESRAWSSDSPLWEAIAKDPQGVPSCEEVSLPLPQGMTSIDQSPLSHHKRPFSVLKSPMAGDRFKSPVVTAVARRQLAFGEANGSQKTPTSPIKSIISSPHNTVISVNSKNLSSIVGNSSIIIQTNEESANQSSANAIRPKRTGSLALFFRKVYNLAHIRLETLCQDLHIDDEEIKRKIWTTLEHTLTHETDLMKDRHIDQLIMCALYIVCKIVGQSKNFIDIMRMYRNQPQAESHVYRSVLLKPRSEMKGEPEKTSKPERLHPPPTPTRLAASSTIIDGEERGDLIKFYNQVFMERLQEYSLKFKRSRQNEAPPLSPLPKLRANPLSPCRKVSETHSVYIRPLKANPADVVAYNPQSPHKPLSYLFSRSPSKDLRAINDLMRTQVEKKSRIGKRLLSDDGPEPNGNHGAEPPSKLRMIGQAVNAKLGIVLGDRSQTD